THISINHIFVGILAFYFGQLPRFGVLGFGSLHLRICIARLQAYIADLELLATAAWPYLLTSSFLSFCHIIKTSIIAAKRYA
ncbi:hypothetical protein QP318_26850, partial [Escherichia coli]|nr:hypothetical protein [Escherichia coli]